MNNLENALFVVDPSNVIRGTLLFNHLERLGIGAFKTVHPGHLNLHDMSSVASALGFKKRQPIAVKRMYYANYVKKQTDFTLDDDEGRHYTIGRYSAVDEKCKILVEANMLRFAAALMRMTYAFMDREHQRREEQPPFTIPNVRFVSGAVCLVHGLLASELSRGATTTLREVYLVEELIGDTEFIKYIHNADAVPMMEEGEDGRELAEFLCFTQHVQYVKSGELAYISDFQGKKFGSLHASIPY